jgi:hypothetical protein
VIEIYMLVAPILSPATMVRSIFSRSSAVGSRFIGAQGIKPLLEVNVEALEHLSFDFFDVGELTPTSDIAVFAGTLKLHNEFLHQPKRVPIFLPEMLFANLGGFWGRVPERHAGIALGHTAVATGYDLREAGTGEAGRAL